MDKTILNLIILMPLMWKQSTQECICLVKETAEYCGAELNIINGNNDCKKDFYFCGESNFNKSAVLLKSCPEDKPCDMIRNRESACLQEIDCDCGRGLSRFNFRKQCGSQLNGKDCGPDVIFRCFGFGSPSPRDACPYGCKDGDCLKKDSVEKEDN